MYTRVITLSVIAAQLTLTPPAFARAGAGGSSVGQIAGVSIESLYLRLPEGTVLRSAHPLSVVRVNQTVGLAVYLRPAPGTSAPVSITWSVQYGSHIVLSTMQEAQKGIPSSHGVRYAIRYTPRASGVYHLIVSTASGVWQDTRTASFTVTSGAGTIGTTFSSSGGYQVTLYSASKAPNTLTLPGGEIVGRARPGTRFIFDAWMVRNSSSRHLRIGRFAMVFGGRDHPGRMLGTSGFPALSYPGEIGLLGFFFEMPKTSRTADFVYRGNDFGRGREVHWIVSVN